MLLYVTCIYQTAQGSGQSLLQYWRIVVLYCKTIIEAVNCLINRVKYSVLIGRVSLSAEETFLTIGKYIALGNSVQKDSLDIYMNRENESKTSQV